MVHAYGVGGMGYEIFCGVGAEVLRLLKKRKGESRLYCGSNTYTELN
jgi:hypothetical protein